MYNTCGWVWPRLVHLMTPLFTNFQFAAAPLDFLGLQIFNNSLASFLTGLQWDNLPTGSVVTSQYPEEPPPPGVTEECPGISLHIQQVCFLLFVSVTLLINMSHCHCCI